MTRRYKAIGATFALGILFFAAIYHFDGDRFAQTGVTIWYGLAVLMVTRWANRTPVG